MSATTKITPPPHIWDFLRENAAGNTFYTSLRDQLISNDGLLSPKQIACVQRAIDEGPAKTLNIPSADDLPAGRYAIDNDEGVLTFYRFWRGDRNPNYVTLHVKHGPDESEIPYGKAVESITQKIVAYGPGRAAIRYGHEIRCCSRCGRDLTHAISRALGIGPICGGHFYGEEFKSVVHGARTMLRESGIDPDAQISADVDVPRYDVEADLTPTLDDIVATHTMTGTDGEWTPRRRMTAQELSGLEAYAPGADHVEDVPSLDEFNASMAAEVFDPALFDAMSDEALESLVALASRILEKRAFAQREAHQERAAYEAKMARDTSFLGR